MRMIPVWSVILGVVGLAAVASGAFFEDSYLRDILLQLGTAALLLVPILLAERSIGQRLARQADDYSVIQRIELSSERDEFFKDHGQKLRSKWTSQPRDLVEAKLVEDQWIKDRKLSSYTIWRKGNAKLALSSEERIPAPHMRALVRGAGWSDQDFAVPWSETREEK